MKNSTNIYLQKLKPEIEIVSDLPPFRFLTYEELHPAPQYLADEYLLREEAREVLQLQRRYEWWCNFLRPVHPVENKEVKYE